MRRRASATPPAGRPSFVIHTVDDPEPLLWSGPLVNEPFGRALLHSLPATPPFLAHGGLQRDPPDLRSVHFVNAHSAAPVCQPSRWSLLTGRYASAGTINGSGSIFFNMRAPSRQTSLPGLLLRHGWATGHFGKYHAHHLLGTSYPELRAQARIAHLTWHRMLT
jgi:arylsulfatase A-like enzyme